MGSGEVSTAVIVLLMNESESRETVSGTTARTEVGLGFEEEEGEKIFLARCCVKLSAPPFIWKRRINIDRPFDLIIPSYTF
jgi:hypothetical protein